MPRGSKERKYLSDSEYFKVNLFRKCESFYFLLRNKNKRHRRKTTPTKHLLTVDKKLFIYI